MEPTHSKKLRRKTFYNNTLDMQDELINNWFGKNEVEVVNIIQFQSLEGRWVTTIYYKDYINYKDYIK